MHKQGKVLGHISNFVISCKNTFYVCQHENVPLRPENEMLEADHCQKRIVNISEEALHDIKDEDAH